ncbi:MAG: hypothetical protein ABWK00_05560 [Desulfurococcaceae archaeon]
MSEDAWREAMACRADPSACEAIALEIESALPLDPLAAGARLRALRAVLGEGGAWRVLGPRLERLGALLAEAAFRATEMLEEGAGSAEDLAVLVEAALEAGAGDVSGRLVELAGRECSRGGGGLGALLGPLLRLPAQAWAGLAGALASCPGFLGEVALGLAVERGAEALANWREFSAVLEAVLGRAAELADERPEEALALYAEANSSLSALRGAAEGTGRAGEYLELRRALDPLVREVSSRIWSALRRRAA